MKLKLSAVCLEMPRSVNLLVVVEVHAIHTGKRTDPSTEEGQRTELSTDQPTESDRKVVQQAGSVPCLGKKCSIMRHRKIGPLTIYFYFLIFFTF